MKIVQKRVCFRAGKKDLMEHYLELPVICQGKGRPLKTGEALLSTFISSIVDGQELVFGKDEEEQFRAFAADEKTVKTLTRD
jgi:hypothetical protein